MSDLQTLGRRLDAMLEHVRNDYPHLTSRFENRIIPLFIRVVDSNTSQDLENGIINSLNATLDLLDMEMKGIFEFN